MHWALNHSSSSQVSDQTPIIMWYCADRLIARWFESDSSTQINVICFIWLQLTYFVIRDHASLAILEFLNGLLPSFPLLLCYFSLLAKRGGDLSIWTGLICPLVFLREILIVTFWLAETVRVIYSAKSFIINLNLFHERILKSSLAHFEMYTVSCLKTAARAGLCGI